MNFDNYLMNKSTYNNTTDNSWGFIRNKVQIPLKSKIEKIIDESSMKFTMTIISIYFIIMDVIIIYYISIISIIIIISISSSYHHHHHHHHHHYHYSHHYYY
jgi:hypothetical protein